MQSTNGLTTWRTRGAKATLIAPFQQVCLPYSHVLIELGCQQLDSKMPTCNATYATSNSSFFRQWDFYFQKGMQIAHTILILHQVAPLAPTKMAC